jgi:hypothetical protein
MNFNQILFNYDESICAGTRYDTGLIRATELDSSYEFVCLNPLHERRLDANVTCYRNLLIESDLMAVDLQVPRMNGLKLPYSCATFSGGKSVHFIISLETPLDGAAVYSSTMSRLYKALESLDFPADEACKNPSRFTRNPGHVRANEKEQTQLYIGARIPTATFMEWLDARCPATEPRTYQPRSNWHRPLTARTKLFLMMGAQPGQRHRALVCAALDFKDCNVPEDECIRKLSRAPGIEMTRSALDAVRWAYRKPPTN